MAEALGLTGSVSCLVKNKKKYQKYYKKIKYAEWKQIFKLIFGLLFKGELVIDGLNSVKSIEKIMR